MTEAQITHIQPRTALKTGCPGFRSLRTQQSASARPPHLQASQWHPRVASVLLTVLRHGDPADRCLSDIPACRSVLLTVLRHGTPAHRHFRDILAWRRRSSDRSSARHHRPEVPQGYARVAKRSSVCPSARHPCPQMPHGYACVAKRSFVCPSARRPCPQMPQRHAPVTVMSLTRYARVTANWQNVFFFVSL